jgi:hypothetical protein
VSYSEAFVRLAKWHDKLGLPPLNQLPGLWEQPLEWTDGVAATVYVNGHPEAVETADGTSVPPWHALVMVNGWPAVLMDAFGGVTLGTGTEDQLIAALDRAEAVR